MSGQDQDQRRRQSQWSLGALTFPLVVAFWCSLAALLLFYVVLGLSSQGWQSVRHEIRKRQSK